MRTGALIGYARVSTAGQLLDRQQHALAEAGCLRIFSDKLSGKDADRPELAACLDYLRPGDTVVVPSLDRLSRSLADLIGIVGTLRRQGVGFKSLHEALDTTTPGGRLVFHVFAALAEFIRELIVEGTREGLDAARGRGVRLGRPPAMTAEQIRHARDLLARPDNTVSSIARLLGVSRATIYKYVPELPARPPAICGPALRAEATQGNSARPDGDGRLPAVPSGEPNRRELPAARADRLPGASPEREADPASDRAADLNGNAPAGRGGRRPVIERDPDPQAVPALAVIAAGHHLQRERLEVADDVNPPVRGETHLDHSVSAVGERPAVL